MKTTITARFLFYSKIPPLNSYAIPHHQSVVVSRHIAERRAIPLVDELFILGHSPRYKIDSVH